MDGGPWAGSEGYSKNKFTTAERLLNDLPVFSASVQRSLYIYSRILLRPQEPSPKCQ